MDPEVLEPMKTQPKITVGIMDRQTEITGLLHGDFCGDGFGPVAGRFSAKAEAGKIVFTDEAHKEICHSPSIRLAAVRNSRFKLFNVTIGNRFHWERTEDQTFQGDIILRLDKDGTIAVINEIYLEDYLTSVISSEMSGVAPMEFLKAHAILSRSWLLAALDWRKKKGKGSIPAEKTTDEEVMRWYDREDHDLFDVCADDHCQRYQGITRSYPQRPKKLSRKPAEW